MVKAPLHRDLPIKNTHSIKKYFSNLNVCHICIKYRFNGLPSSAV